MKSEENLENDFNLIIITSQILIYHFIRIFCVLLKQFPLLHKARVVSSLTSPLLLEVARPI